MVISPKMVPFGEKWCFGGPGAQTPTKPIGFIGVLRCFRVQKLVFSWNLPKMLVNLVKMRFWGENSIIYVLLVLWRGIRALAREAAPRPWEIIGLTTFLGCPDGDRRCYGDLQIYVKCMHFTGNYANDAFPVNSWNFTGVLLFEAHVRKHQLNYRIFIG